MAIFIIKPVDKTKLSCITLPPPLTWHHSFSRNLPSLLLCSQSPLQPLLEIVLSVLIWDKMYCSVSCCEIGNNWSFFFLFSLMESFLTQRKNPELWNKQNFHQTVLFWFLNFIQYASSLYSSLCISFWTEKENWFNNQSFLGCWSFPVLSWSQWMNW